MATTTTNFAFTKPGVADPVDADIWGGQLNTNWDSNDSLLKVARDFVVNASETGTTVTVVAADRNTLTPCDTTSNNITVNLIAAAMAGDGFEIAFKKTDAVANTVTIDGSGSETIDGALTYALSSQNDAVLMVCDGTNWQVLSAVGIADNAVTLAKMADQTQGDVLYYGASGVASVLGAGTSGQVLITNGAAANPSWGTISATGVLLSAVTPSAASTVDFTSFVDDATYDNYFITGNLSLSGGNGTDLWIRTSTDGGSTYDSGTHYRYGMTGLEAGGTTISWNSSGTNQILVADNYNTSSDINFSLTLYDPSNTKWTMFKMDVTYVNNSVLDSVSTMGHGTRSAAADVDAFQFLPSAGTITGNIQLYGLLK